jgi:hypothetical protein
MWDQLLPQEKSFPVQEAIVGFIYEQIIKPIGEFHYDGHILDRNSKYSMMSYKTLLHFSGESHLVCVYVYIYIYIY